MITMKGQTAIEFLSVYGFMLIIAALFLAFILLLAFTSQGSLQNVQCNAFSGFYCLNAQFFSNTIAGNSMVFLYLKNQQSVPVNVLGANVIIGNVTYAGTCTPSLILPANQVTCIAPVNGIRKNSQQVIGSYIVRAGYCNSPLYYVYTAQCTFQNVTYTGSFSTFVTQTIVPQILSTYSSTSSTSTTTTSLKSTSTSTITNVFYVPITLTNSQPTATPAPFQDMITVDSATYASYINSNWDNVEFTTGPGDSGTVLNAWVESGASSSSTNTIVWVNLPNGIAASNSILIYMNFMTSSVLSAAGPTGEAPTLSTPYAAYDDGNVVFTAYQDFAGSACPSGWSCSGAVVNNGLAIPASSSYAVSSAKYGQNLNQILDFYGTVPSASNSNPELFGYVSTSGNSGPAWELQSALAGNAFGSSQFPGGSLMLRYYLNTVATITTTDKDLGIAVSPNGQYAYTAGFGAGGIGTGNVLTIISTSTESVLKNIAIGKGPYAVAVTPDGNYVYVSGYTTYWVNITSTKTNSVVNTITGTGQAAGVSSDLGSDTVYWGSKNTGLTYYAVVPDNSISNHISTAGEPAAVGTVPSSGLIYVASDSNKKVYVINPSTHTVLATLAVGTTPRGFAFTSNGGTAYVVNEGDSNVLQINVASNTITNSINVDSQPDGIAISPDGKSLYTTSWNKDNIDIINTTINEVVDRTDIGVPSTKVAVNPVNGYLYVTSGPDVYYTGAGAYTVTVLSPQATGILSGQHVYSVYYPAASSIKNYVSYDYGVLTYNFSSGSSGSEGMGVVNNQGANAASGPFYWFRIRAYPPDAAMPSATFGGVA